MTTVIDVGLEASTRGPGLSQPQDHADVDGIEAGVLPSARRLMAS
jgi:hypothetical protein